MKAISLYQPYATAMALGLKTIETRSWSSWYVGDIVIHAAKTFPRGYREFAETEATLGRIPGPERLPFGMLLCVVHLICVDHTVNVVSRISAIERMYGDYSPGRYAWITDNVRAFKEPIPYRGQQGLFEVSDEIVKEGLE